MTWLIVPEALPDTRVLTDAEFHRIQQSIAPSLTDDGAIVVHVEVSEQQHSFLRARANQIASRLRGRP